ncbi:hypothetical protein F5146DRAFT_1125237 [Armillaria mellea]|nr:hypothetical protein F5146DRAFT_1125237 [Armillaria mellea]
MSGLNLAESSLAQTLVAFMGRAASLTLLGESPWLVSLNTYRPLPTTSFPFFTISWMKRYGSCVPRRTLYSSDQREFHTRPFVFQSSIDSTSQEFPPRHQCYLSSGQAALAAELKAVGFHYISRIPPGALGTHAALMDDLPAVFSVLKRSARDIVDTIDALEQRIFRFRDCFADMSWVETMVGNTVLVKGMLDVLLSISHEQSRSISSSNAVALLHRNLDEDIDISTSSSAFLYDWTKDGTDFPNKDALSLTLLRLHALCYSEDTSQSIQPHFYSELATHFSELLKAYKNKVRLSHFARHVRHMLHLALIVADPNELLAKNAQILIDFLDDTTVQISSEELLLQYHKFHIAVNHEIDHVMNCLNKEAISANMRISLPQPLVASALNLVNGGSDATINVVSTVLALMAVLGMAVGNSTVSPDSMMEIQELAQILELAETLP